MDNVTQIVQKVRQAPWRVHRQWIGLFMLGLVVIAMVAAIYLNVTVRATLAGRQIQLLLNPSLVNQNPGSELNSISTNLRINTELESQLAALTSVETMRKRAEEMGFQPASPDDMIFISVPGYIPQSAVDLSSPPSDQPPAPVILPEYTESWFDYFLNQQIPSAPTGGQQ